MDMIIVFAKRLKINKGREEYTPSTCWVKTLGRVWKNYPKQVAAAPMLVLSNGEGPPIDRAWEPDLQIQVTRQ